MELQGRVVKVLPTTSGVSEQTGNQWQKQEFIFGFYENPSDIYECQIKLSLRNEKIQQYNLAENDRIKVRVRLNCREYPQSSGKYYNDIYCGDITIMQKADMGNKQPSNGETQQQPNNSPQAQQPAPQGNENTEGGEADDLPF